jgi:hypothetical protein
MAREALVVAAVEKGAVVRVAGARARVTDMAATPQTLMGYDGRVKILPQISVVRRSMKMSGSLSLRPLLLRRCSRFRRGDALVRRVRDKVGRCEAAGRFV